MAPVVLGVGEPRGGMTTALPGTSRGRGNLLPEQRARQDSRTLPFRVPRLVLRARGGDAMADGRRDRNEWVELAGRLARPVLWALAAHRLKATMPVETAPGTKPEDRRRFAHLKALGRLLAGLAPWLELPAEQTPEGKLRLELAGLAGRALDAATDPRSPDVLNFSEGRQPLVDAAFLAHALLRAPNNLWGPLPPRARANLVAALKQTRALRPPNSNRHAVRSHQDWYKGDGIYGDGPPFHWDHYNSFVIHPMLIDVLEVLGRERKEWQALRVPVRARARRYAA